MIGRLYKKDLLQSFAKSKGRFFSIFSLMMIGSLALVGLKVTTPNMQRTAQTYITETHLMDLAVMADYGLSAEDQAELRQIKGASVEFGYLTDVTIAGQDEAVRLFSSPKTLSTYRVRLGRLPETAHEVALSEQLSPSYQIGDTIHFTPSSDSPLTTDTFTVTGFVQSAELWDKEVLGQTRAGTGDLMAYGVTTEAAFDSSVYMIARLAYDELRGEPFFTETYDRKIAEHQQQLTALLADNGSQRWQVLRADAQSEIDRGRKQLTETKEQIANGEEQLAEARGALSQGQNQLEKGQELLNQGQAELARAQHQLATSQAELAQSKKQLDDSKLELERAEAELTKTSHDLAEAALALETGKQQLHMTKQQLEQTGEALKQSQLSLTAEKNQLDELAANLALDRQVWQTEVSRLEAEKQEWLVQGQDPQTIPSLVARESQLAETAQRLTQLEKNLQQGQADYQSNLTIYENERSAYQTAESQYRSALEDYDLQLAAYQEGKAAYEAGLADYQQGKADYETGLPAYQSGLASYQAGLSAYVANQSRLNQESLLISQEQDRLSSAQAELERSQSAFDHQKADAKAQIASAEKELEQATERVNQLTEPDYQVYTRQTLPGGQGYDTFKTGASAISAVGNIFPVVLYLVAALVTLTTMTRFVDEERRTIGIFKSLGFTNQAIMAKFIVYGLVASLAGTLVGVILGHTVLSSMIGNILTQKLVLGQISHSFYPGWSLVAVLLALVSAVLPTYLVVRRDLLFEKPAQLLLPKPPATGSSIWLERLTVIWKRLSFTHKVTARNIFRYKQRMLMTIFGVAGSVALLFAGLGIQSSISGVAKTQFGELLTYELILVENSRASQEDKDQLTRFLETATIAQKLPIRFFSTSETIQQTGDQTITLLVADQPQLNDFIQLRQRQTKEPLKLSDKGAIVTEKLASLYGVGIGDQLTVTLEDCPVTLTVAGISELYAGHYIYLSEAYYEKLQPKPSPPNSYLIQLKDQSPEHIKETAAEALKQHAVASVVQNTTLEMALAKTADSLSAVMLVLIALSILLAVVILYNLTTINVAERIRELSTIKVLGFHHKEVTLYIYRETIVLSLVGIMLGLGGGVYLHRLLLNMIASPSLMFQPQVALSVYLIPVLAIAVILIVLGVLINHRLRQVDMLEALKSLE